MKGVQLEPVTKIQIHFRLLLWKDITNIIDTFNKNCKHIGKKYMEYLLSPVAI